MHRGTGAVEGAESLTHLVSESGDNGTFLGSESCKFNPFRLSSFLQEMRGNTFLRGWNEITGAAVMCLGIES